MQHLDELLDELDLEERELKDAPGPWFQKNQRRMEIRAQREILNELARRERRSADKE